jgi:hypothetical protein
VKLGSIGHRRPVLGPQIAAADRSSGIDFTPIGCRANPCTRSRYVHVKWLQAFRQCRTLHLVGSHRLTPKSCGLSDLNRAERNLLRSTGSAWRRCTACQSTSAIGWHIDRCSRSGRSQRLLRRWRRFARAVSELDCHRRLRGRTSAPARQGCVTRASLLIPLQESQNNQNEFGGRRAQSK